MITDELMEELESAFDAEKKARARLQHVCHKVSMTGGGVPAEDLTAKPSAKRPASPPETCLPAGEISDRLKAELQTGNIKPQDARTGGRGKNRKPVLPGERKEYWRKVQCSACHKKLGSRVSEGRRFPVVHPGEDGKVCPGSVKPGEPVTGPAES